MCLLSLPNTSAFISLSLYYFAYRNPIGLPLYYLLHKISPSYYFPSFLSLTQYSFQSFIVSSFKYKVRRRQFFLRGFLLVAFLPGTKCDAFLDARGLPGFRCLYFHKQYAIPARHSWLVKSIRIFWEFNAKVRLTFGPCDDLWPLTCSLCCLVFPLNGEAGRPSGSTSAFYSGRAFVSSSFFAVRLLFFLFYSDSIFYCFREILVGWCEFQKSV